ncbi:hypothetical protein OZN48_18345, partial [Chryseobacterium indologenes]
NSNITSFTKLIEPKNQLNNVININELNFNELEIEIINNFLNWENDSKNLAIFNISNIALEYCLISNKKGNNFKLENLRNKNFYLDTNVIFRAIGINGEIRKQRVLTFLDKFKDAQENILISKFTFEELKKTISYYVNTLNKKNSLKINSKLFIQYSTNSDFLEYYHKWRKDRTNDNLDLFEAHIFSQIDKLKETYKIKIDYNIPFDIKDDAINNFILDKASSIKSFKQSEKSNLSPIVGAVIDAQNIFLIEKRRDGQNINIFDCKYYLISTDQYLRKWDYTQNKEIPIVILPSQWMCILLRYLNRTNDDFKSFVSFLNISNSEKLISNDNLQLILNGISEITTDFTLQNGIISEMVNKKFIGVLEKGSNEDEIIHKAKEFAKTKLENDIEKVQQQNKDLETKFEKYQNHTTTALTKLKQLKDDEKEEKESLEKENKEIKEELFKTKINRDFIKYQILGFIFLGIGIICALFLFLTFFFTDSEWNVVNVVRNYSNNLKSESIEKEIIKYLYILPISLFGYSCIIVNQRLISKSNRAKKKEELKNKHFI